MTYPSQVRIYEMGPRDGLQNEAEPVDVATRVALVDRLTAAGLPAIEAGAFVSPKWVPRMAGSDAVFAGITREPGVVYAALVPNQKGLEQAIAARVDEIGVFTAASESFNKKNINAGIDESFARLAPVIAGAKQAGIPVRGYVSCVAVCPYEGPIDPARVAEVAARLDQLGCREVSLGDTIGAGTVGTIGAMLDAVLARVPADRLAVHFHDTYGQALANIHLALQRGIAVIDTAVAGLGGCPYAPGASGNVATEDVVYMLDGLGVRTGVDLAAVAQTARWITGQLGRVPAGKCAQALIAKADAA